MAQSHIEGIKTQDSKELGKIPGRHHKETVELAICRQLRLIGIGSPGKTCKLSQVCDLARVSCQLRTLGSEIRRHHSISRSI